MDILATNRLGRALYAEAYGDNNATFNLARYIFLDARSHGFYRDWETVAGDCVAALRTQAGRNPYDRGLTDLIGELSTRSEQFRTWWATAPLNRPSPSSPAGAPGRWPQTPPISRQALRRVAVHPDGPARWASDEPAPLRLGRVVY